MIDILSIPLSKKTKKPPKNKAKKQQQQQSCHIMFWNWLYLNYLFLFMFIVHFACGWNRSPWCGGIKSNVLHSGTLGDTLYCEMWWWQSLIFTFVSFMPRFSPHSFDLDGISNQPRHWRILFVDIFWKQWIYIVLIHHHWYIQWYFIDIPDNKVYGDNMGPTWVLSALAGPHVGPMNLAIWDSKLQGW